MIIYIVVLIMGVLLSSTEIFLLETNAKILKKINKVNSNLYLLVLFFLFGFNRYNGDYLNYQNFFETDFKDIEVGFYYLNKIVRIIIGRYEAILFIIGCLLFIKFKYVFFNNIKYRNLILFLYFLFPFLVDINQIRNYLMIFFVYFSLQGIIEKHMKKYLYILCAISMHKFALIYIPFIFISKYSLKKYIKIILLSMATLFFVNSLVVKILSQFYPNKILYYLDRKPGLGIFLIIGYIVIDIFIVTYIYLKIDFLKLNEKERNMIDIYYKFIIYPIIIIPFLFYFLEIKRIERNVLLIKYFFCIYNLKFLKMKEKLFVIGFLIFSAIIPLLVFIYEKSYFYFEDISINYILEFIKKI